MFLKFPKQKAAELLEQCRESEAAYQLRLREIEAARPAAALPIEERIAEAGQHMGQVVQDTGLQFQRLADVQRERYRGYRLFQVMKNIWRPAALPDPLMTAFLAMICILAEGAMAGALMISDGKMDIMTGFAYGLSFAAINIIVGLVIGYFPLRYVGYNADALNASMKDCLIRLFSWAGLGALLSLLALLIFSAARVRATGAHHGIFDFSTVGFFGTFNDALSLAIIALGIMGSIIAIYKGYQGIHDPVPGYTDVRKRAEEQIRDASFDLHEEALVRIDAVYDDAAESLEDCLMAHKDAQTRYTQDIKALNEQIAAHNNFVRKCQDELRLYADDNAQTHAFIDQAPPIRDQLNIYAFETLLVEGPLDLPRSHTALIETGTTHLNRLTAVRDKAISEITATYHAFEAGAPDFQAIPLEHGGINDNAPFQITA